MGFPGTGSILEDPMRFKHTLLLYLLLGAGIQAAEKVRQDDPNDIAGPVVKSIGELKEAVALANTTDGGEAKQTIAQYLDKALEKEFPEEKHEAIGKNYNETSKSSDVSPAPTYVPGAMQKSTTCLEI